MAKRKRGRPRSPGRLKKCPRCGRLGHPVTKTHTKTVKGKTYTWEEEWFSHYSRDKLRAGEPTHAEWCYIPKKKTVTLAAPVR